MAKSSAYIDQDVDSSMTCYSGAVTRALSRLIFPGRNGKDLRRQRLIDRKHELKRVISGPSPIMYAEHVERCGSALFEKACELDLEGIVAKDGRAPYEPEQTTWFKIRNRSYSQTVGREELFERERHLDRFRAALLFSGV